MIIYKSLYFNFQVLPGPSRMAYVCIEEGLKAELLIEQAVKNKGRNKFMSFCISRYNSVSLLLSLIGRVSDRKPDSLFH